MASAIDADHLKPDGSYPDAHDRAGIGNRGPRT